MPLKIDPKTQRTGPFARVQVDVDCSKELPTKILVQRRRAGFDFFGNIYYEFVPYFCHCCGTIGHKMEACRNMQKQAEKLAQTKNKQLEKATQEPVRNNAIRRVNTSLVQSVTTRLQFVAATNKEGEQQTSPVESAETPSQITPNYREVEQQSNVERVNSGNDQNNSWQFQKANGRAKKQQQRSAPTDLQWSPGNDNICNKETDHAEPNSDSRQHTGHKDLQQTVSSAQVSSTLPIQAQLERQTLALVIQIWETLLE